MYTIVKGMDGRFHCQGRLQDGAERWIKDTLDEAVASMKKFARVLNGTKIKKKDITFLQERPAAGVECVPWDPWRKGKR